jgi:ParB/RepB/Spo0J family partition protein
MEVLMLTMPLGALREHPLNGKIYFTDEADDKELRDSIERDGIIHPIVITKEGKILSGHRRYKAAITLGLHEVPILYCDPGMNNDDEIQYLITSNMYRAKSMEEKVREGQQLKDVLARKGEKSRDSIGKALDMSGRTFSKAEKVVEAIDAIKESDPEQAEHLRQRLNKSVDGAFKEVQGDKEVMDNIQVDIQEEIEDLEEKRKYFYLDDIVSLTTYMQVIYDKLAKKRNGTTPISVGSMIGNIYEMKERLGTWYPKRMSACPKCGGTGQIHTRGTTGDDTIVKCPVCVDGKIGLFKESSK